MISNVDRFGRWTAPRPACARSLASRSLATLFLAIAFPAVSWGQSSDRVFQVDGRTLSGTITQVSSGGITIDVGGRATEVPSSNVKMVNFADEPRELTDARRMIVDGRLNNAAQELDGLDPTRLEPVALADDVRFLVAFCAAKMAMSGEQGTLAEASDLMQAFLDQAPESYRYFEAVELYGDLLVARGDFGGAETQFAKLVQAPWPEASQIGHLKVGRTQELQGKHAEAAASYGQVGQVESASASSRQAKLSARVGLARCQAFQGNPQAAIDDLNRLILEESSTNQDLFAQIYNALGNCYRLAGNDKAAITAFLHTDLLYFGNADFHAEALFYLGELFAKIDKFDESNEMKEKLKTRYASSPWASRRPGE